MAVKVAKDPNEQHFNLDGNQRGVYGCVPLREVQLVVGLEEEADERVSKAQRKSTSSDLRSLELSFHWKHKDLALNSYLPFIINESKKRNQIEKTVKLFTFDRRMSYLRYPTTWTSVNLDHPATFETVATNSGAKEKVMKDLDMFLQRRGYYQKVGKAWKRGRLHI